MPLNLTKKYPDLLDLIMSEEEILKSLRGIFRRDIEENRCFYFRDGRIYPLKQDGQVNMDILFQHLTCKTEERIDASSGKSYKARIFDKVRSERLHWIKHHIDERSPNLIEVFTLTERRDGKDATKTYIYDTSHAYVIILEHQRKGGYYLLTAHYLSEVYAKKQLEKKMKLSQIQDLNKTQGSIHI